jgi:hypothetical protein
MCSYEKGFAAKKIYATASAGKRSIMAKVVATVLRN